VINLRKKLTEVKENLHEWIEIFEQIENHCKMIVQCQARIAELEKELDTLSQ